MNKEDVLKLIQELMKNKLKLYVLKLKQQEKENQKNFMILYQVLLIQWVEQFCLELKKIKLKIKQNLFQ